MLYEKLSTPQNGAPSKINHVVCLAHARRYLFEAFEKTQSPLAAEALIRIQDLYAIEREITGKSAHQHLAARRARAAPLLDAFKTWMEEKRQRI